MAKKVSTKKPLFGNKRSHALNATKTKQKPNFQTVTINGIKVKLTAREAKLFKKIME
ncbi:MAG: bL28 family ribosomal protein [Bacilli bacterium]|nr:bL28 family ribosomal protein [Bacilli bacterium]